MSTTNNRRPQPGRMSTETLALFVCAVLVVVIVATVYLAVHVGHQLAGLPPAPKDPWETLAGVIRGKVQWPMASTVAVVMILLIIVPLAIFGRNQVQTQEG